MSPTYGTGVPEPTGYGLPGYADAEYRTRPRPDTREWCEQAGCPKSQCVACQKHSTEKGSA